MNDWAIKVENISKLYRIGLKEQMHETMVGAALDFLRSPVKNYRRLRGLSRIQETETENEDIIWALKDVSFEVKQGEVLGIIGANGAGKSTLLKILSGITEPTFGRALVKGRVASLLEVGTGFHPELTGRENIYLNGTILGMTKAEIDRKFDEIVDFSGVEKFIDTPVKRYSSGMSVRLAFAVAAHLEPEILLIDEVLAVGDAEFQRKCLGKMEEVAVGGRTILFVSHNMQALQSLCDEALRLQSGETVGMGAAESQVASYLAGQGGLSPEKRWDPQNAPGDATLRLISVRVLCQDSGSRTTFSSKADILVEMKFEVYEVLPAFCVGFDILTVQGTVVARTYQTDMAPGQGPALKRGVNRWRCRIPAGLLNAGTFLICPRIGLHNTAWTVHMEAAVQFEVLLDHGVSPFWNSLDAKSRPGVISPIFEWSATGD